MQDDITQAEADADVANAYFRRLLARGIERADAVNMTTSYLSSTLMSRGMNRRPPWE